MGSVHPAQDKHLQRKVAEVTQVLEVIEVIHVTAARVTVVQLSHLALGLELLGNGNEREHATRPVLDLDLGPLVAQGIDPRRVRTISFGKERPVALGSNKGAWSQNRRGVTVVN